MSAGDNMRSIETAYNGTVYRSRTEARWALLFDLSEVEFQYEPEGYQLYSGWYVPDFWIPSWGCFFEVKPASVIIAAGHYNDERSKAEDLAMETGHDVLFGCGNPEFLMSLVRVPAEGISPREERLIDFVQAHHISHAKAHRFDWREPVGHRPSAVGSWEPIGMPAWSALKGANRARKR